MKPDEAMSRIDSIYATLQRTAHYKGYRSGSILVTACLGIAGVIIQSLWIDDPVRNIDAYLWLWFSIALLSFVIGSWHAWSKPATTSGEKSRRQSAFLQLIPPLVAGAVLTVIIADKFSQSIWMLPGLWAIFFGLALCATASMLPKQVLIPGAYFVGTGLWFILFGDSFAPLSPWQMLVSFGIGQALNALVIYWTIERLQHRVGEQP